MKPLYKTTIVIWTEEDTRGWELEDLAREATVGVAYCSTQTIAAVLDPEEDPDWDGTEFFMDDYHDPRWE